MAGVFEECMQSTITICDNKTAQFKCLWIIRDYIKVKANLPRRGYIETNQPLTIIPGKFVCRIRFYPYGNLPCRQAHFRLYNNEESVIWMSASFVVVDKNGEEHLKAMFDTPAAINNTSGYQQLFWCPTYFSDNEKDIFLPNGCLQFRIRGIVWIEEPLMKKKYLDGIFSDSSLTPIQENEGDVILAIGDEQFLVHKNILSTRSKVFEKLLSNESKNNIVVISDITPQVFREVLNFINNDELASGGDNLLPDILRAAVRFNLYYLAEICKINMKRLMSIENVVECLSVSNDLNIPDLKDNAMDFIVENFKNVSETDSWKEFVSKNELVGKFLSKAMN